MAKRLLITGAASGLGRELALSYAQQGAYVAVADIHQQRANETVEQIESRGGTAYALSLDVRDIEQFESAKQLLVEQWGGVDVLINNAGVASAGNFADTSIDTWDWMLSINLMGAVKGCKVFAPLFQQQGFGHFVNIASMAGLLNPPGMADYNVAKAGVIALSETLHSELAPHNIFTTVVCPSFFKTNLGESLKVTDQVSSDSFAKLLDRSDLSAADIAGIIVNAVEAKEFLIMPHEKARAAYQHKLSNPDEYFKGMAGIAQRTLEKQRDL